MSNENKQTAEAAKIKSTLTARMGERFGVDGVKVLETLKRTAFKQHNGNEPTNEQMMSLLIVAEQYGLNPFTKEIYAYPEKDGGIVPVVGVDGWSRIINNHPAMDGLEFIESTTKIQMDGSKVDCPEWIECIIYRSDRKHPIKIREYLDEVYRAPFTPRGKTYTIDGPWQSHPKRLLRHKSLIQASRIAFGFSGIYDQDEASRIMEAKDMGSVVRVERETTPKPSIGFAEVERITTTLINRAIQNGGWDTSMSYLSERFSGQELEIASNKLEMARQEHELMSLSETKNDTREYSDSNDDEVTVGEFEDDAISPDSHHSETHSYDSEYDQGAFL